MAARIFLTCVGCVYLALSAWCALRPGAVAVSLGFELQPGSGQSEFLVVYGGLQFALACLFLSPWLQPRTWQFAMISCAIVHGSLALFRLISIVVYRPLENAIIAFGAIEIALFVGAVVLIRKSQGRRTE